MGAGLAVVCTVEWEWEWKIVESLLDDITVGWSGVTGVTQPARSARLGPSAEFGSVGLVFFWSLRFVYFFFYFLHI